MAFPRFTIRDMVKAQRALLAELGIERLAAVVGASMGGMQAMQWAVSYPDVVERVVALTPSARTHPWTRLINEAARGALMGDPAWAAGAYTDQPVEGWRAWTLVIDGLATRCPEAFDAPFPTNGASAWIEERRDLVAHGALDANDWIYQSWAYDAHDVGDPGEASPARATEVALSRIAARTLVITPPLDLYNPVSEAARIVAHVPDASHVVIPSLHGHLATGGNDATDAVFINSTIAAFLRSTGLSPGRSIRA